LADALVEVWDEGNAALPLDPDLPPAALAETLKELRPARLVTSSGAARLPGGPPVEAGTALVVRTSGSTGRPRGVELTHDALEAAAAAGARRLEVTSEDRWLCCLPLHHIGGLQVLLRSRLTRAAPVIHDRFDPEGIARQEDANLVSLVPTMLVRLLDAGVDLTRFKRVVVGGAAAAPQVVERARAEGVAVVQTYGMTETCGGVVYDAVPLDGVDVAVGADGAIALRGPVIMRGYRNQPGLTSSVLKDGWFHTSDVGALDHKGRLTVYGRADEMIVTGGRKVAPQEVAAVLSGHPGIQEAAVFAVDDPVWGQRVVAAVVPAPGAAPEPEELRAHVSRQIEGFKAPREVILVEALPRLPSGKLDRAGVLRFMGSSR
jgi:O-succinylbenzoic acid--CoA ligase